MAKRGVELALLDAEADLDDNSHSSSVDVVGQMDGLPQNGTLTLIVNNKRMLIRFRYLFNDDDIKVRLNYSDMASVLRKANANNFAEMSLEFSLEIEN